MNSSTAILFALIVSLTPCLASLGENWEENVRRYGRPLAKKFDESGPEFEKKGMFIEAVTNCDKALVMTYQKTEKDDSGNFVKMADAEIKLLLAENIEQGSWVKVREGVWGHKTEQKAAYYDLGENRLYVCTKSARFSFERSIDLYMRLGGYEKKPEKWERILEKISMMDSWWPK